MTSNCALESIGKRISQLRSANNMTQAELGEKVRVSREQINYWENGRRDMKTENIVLIADALNTTCDYLLRGVESSNMDVHRATGLSNYAIILLKTLNKTPNMSAVNAFLGSSLFPGFIIRLYHFMALAEQCRCNNKDSNVVIPTTAGLHYYETEEFKRSFELNEMIDLQVFRLMNELKEITDEIKEGILHENP